MKNAELKSLCQKVGKRLTNRIVQVRFQEPAYRNAKGTACKRGNKAVVDIEPGMSSEEFLRVFLHELGHVKVLWGSWTVEIPDYEPGSMSLPESFRTSGSVSLAEDAADTLAKEWFSYANEHAADYEGSWLVSRLKALERYLEPELLEIMERAVNSGVEKALKKLPISAELRKAELLGKVR